MATQKQIAANRSNARFSTGPRTADGRANSARNSLKHGMRAREIILLAGENPDEWRAVAEGYLSRFAPADAYQLTLVMEMVQGALMVARSRRIEASLLASEWDRKDLKRLRVVLPSEKDKDQTAHNGATQAHTPVSLEGSSDADLVSTVNTDADAPVADAIAFEVTQMDDTESATLELLGRGFIKNAQIIALWQSLSPSPSTSMSAQASRCRRLVRSSPPRWPGLGPLQV
jgi:hypothetical protein